MSQPSEDRQVLLVCCALCHRLHEPRSALELNPICTGCAEAPPGVSHAGPGAPATSDGESP